jgi:hypothetical protein
MLYVNLRIFQYKNCNLYLISVRSFALFQMSIILMDKPKKVHTHKKLPIQNYSCACAKTLASIFLSPGCADFINSFRNYAVTVWHADFITLKVCERLIDY